MPSDNQAKDAPQLRREMAAVARRMTGYAAVGATLGLRRNAEQEYRILGAQLEQIGAVPRLRAKYTGGIR